MAIREKIPNIASLRQVNGEAFSKADYVNYVANISDSPIDVALSFSSIFFPVVSIINGMGFNESADSYRHYLNNIEKGMTKHDAYYWCHVTDIEGLFRIDRAAADKIADCMCIGWNASFKEKGISNVYFRKLVDEEIVLEPVVGGIIDFKGLSS